jgi:hypothetical protein
MLAVANWITGPDCTVRVSTPDLVQFSNAARSSVVSAVDVLVKTGELELLEEARGTRAALYKIPGAVGYVRPELRSRGPETGPLAYPPSPGCRTPTAPQGSGNRTSKETFRGPETGQEGSGNRTSRGPETGPHYQYQEPSKQADQPNEQQQTDDYGIPDFARPLVDGLSNAGVVVRWPFVGNQWVIIHALIKKSGIRAMVDHARKAASRSNVESAKYFLQGWRELPPLPRTDSQQDHAQRFRQQAEKPPWCGDVDCDEKTRTRDVEDDRGLRYSQPCPKCHPAARKDSAA